MKNITLMANTGIQTLAVRITINTPQKHTLWFRQWQEQGGNDKWHMELVHKLTPDGGGDYFYNMRDLFLNGFLADGVKLDPAMLKGQGIEPLRIDDENCPGIEGDIFSMTFTDKASRLEAYENQWLPLPYFMKRTENLFDFGPLNWARAKFMPRQAGVDKGGLRQYDVLLAFDTRARHKGDKYNEYPVFRDQFRTEVDFDLCSDLFKLMDYCSTQGEWNFVEKRLLELAHPGVTTAGQIKNKKDRNLSYIASYILLVDYLASNKLLPSVRLYQDKGVETKDVDMVVDVGNSRTTALLLEQGDAHSFNPFTQVRQLQLIDYTDLLKSDEEGVSVRSYDEPFDMRLAFRKASFGNFGYKDSNQFVYPSLVRLGTEASNLIRRARSIDEGRSLSTYSSPKRYLWDAKPSQREWTFMVLKGEADDHVLSLRGVTDLLSSDGRPGKDVGTGQTHYYSRRSLMTFAFLEMLTQATVQVNSHSHRSVEQGFGNPEMPRKIKRIIVTCPTAMSNCEREALINCAKDAAKIHSNFFYDVPLDGASLYHNSQAVQVIPALHKDEDGNALYYDEATCAQLVYIYGEVGWKYKGCQEEFFRLYGKKDSNAPAGYSITVGSLDIGAGTTDLMISKYSCADGGVPSISPEPLFFDSFYQAGDDMLHSLVKNLMLLDDDSAFRQKLADLSYKAYRQKMKDFFGYDFSGQTMADRELRRDFNIQYTVPLMYHYLDLLRRGISECSVRFSDVFDNCPPSPSVLEGFKEKTGIDVREIAWKYRASRVADEVGKSFEPLLKKIATIMYSYGCDVVLLSGRPASLPPVRDLFLKYYTVAPNRLIVLNGYYVGDWYPFGENTGYIRNPKTIVAMGGVIAHYSSSLSRLGNFSIDLTALGKALRSQVNFVETPWLRRPADYFLTPTQNTGDITLTSLPEMLWVRRMDLDSYPARPLFNIDFDRIALARRIERKITGQGGPVPKKERLRAMAADEINDLRARMPFTITIERDLEDKESLIIVSAMDSKGNDVNTKDLDIHVQSVGKDEQYWLDTGSFDI